MPFLPPNQQYQSTMAVSGIKLLLKKNSCKTIKNDVLKHHTERCVCFDFVVMDVYWLQVKL